MKKPMLLLLAVITSGAIAVALADGTPQPKPAHNPEVEELRVQVSQLRAQVQVLETRMNKLEELTQRPPPTAPTPLNR